VIDEMYPGGVQLLPKPKNCRRCTSKVSVQIVDEVEQNGESNLNIVEIHLTGDLWQWMNSSLTAGSLGPKTVPIRSKPPFWRKASPSRHPGVRLKAGWLGY
jgi:hypothetical protein